MANFEVFSKDLVPLKRDMTITLQKNGVLSLNKAAHVALGEPGHVELLYDEASRTIGLRGVDARAEHASAVRCSTATGSGPFVVSVIAFLNFYEIKVSISRRWRAYLEGDVLCLDLDAESVPVTSNRAKARVPSGQRPSLRSTSASGAGGLTAVMGPAPHRSTTSASAVTGGATVGTVGAAAPVATASVTAVPASLATSIAPRAAR